MILITLANCSYVSIQLYQQDRDIVRAILPLDLEHFLQPKIVLCSNSFYWPVVMVHVH